MFCILRRFSLGAAASILLEQGVAILASAHRLRKSFGAKPLFDAITFSIESGERVGLIGPNGAGKTTLLRILAGEAEPDDGTLSFSRGLRIGYLAQVPQFAPGATIWSTVMEGSRDPDDWQEMSRAQEVLSRLSLSEDRGVAPETPIETLSGGWKKRVALARELVRQPDLMLLDEPTNHLDVESILWLETLLARSRFAAVTITHDRVFLQRVANRILELDRRNKDGLLSIKGDYATYLETKANQIASQQAQEVRLRNTLRRETEWLRRGAKARTTKQKARIDRHAVTAAEVEDLAYKNQARNVRLDFQGSERSPNKLLEADSITKHFAGRPVIPKFSLRITPKSRIGLLGPNGCGKSTLIKILLGQEKPDSGSIFRADSLKVSYFEQNRDTLDPEVSVLKTVCPSGDFVDFQGSKVHVRSYLDRFLFSGDQANMKVGKLSGGEQSRLLLALLMLREANVLVLDEPTNDLDLETLDVLEGVLQEFRGAVILVTHDRYFLDQVAREIIAFGRDSKSQPILVPLVGLEQWEEWHEEQEELRTSGPMPEAPEAPAASAVPATKKKLSYKEQRELDGMETKIKTLEDQLAEFTRQVHDPKIASNSVKLAEITQAMGTLEAEIARCYERWAELS